MHNAAIKHSPEQPPVQRVVRDPFGTSAKIVSFLDSVRYKVMRSHEELALVERLRYKSYHGAELIAQTEVESWGDEDDHDVGYTNIGVYVDRVLRGAIRVNPLNLSYHHSIAYDMYRPTLDPMLEEGARFVDASRFCHDADFPSSLAMPFATVRLIGIAAAWHRASHVLATARTKHIRFYEKFLGAKRVDGSEAVYETDVARIAASLFIAEMEQLKDRAYGSQQYFLADEEEMRALFDDSWPKGATVVPSAHRVIAGADCIYA
jgi:hypothetical protein